MSDIPEHVLIVSDDHSTGGIHGRDRSMIVLPLSEIINYVDAYHSRLRGSKFDKVLLPERLQEERNGDLLGRAITPIYFTLMHHGEGYRDRVKFY